MRILVVDDDRKLSEEVKNILARNQHTADCLDNADEAVARVASGDYDFVLVDYKMPDHDGLWFMKNAKLPRRTKALLVTSFVDRNMIKTMFAAGVSGYIIKPFDEEELIRILNFHQERREFPAI